MTPSDIKVFIKFIITKYHKTIYWIETNFAIDGRLTIHKNDTCLYLNDHISVPISILSSDLIHSDNIKIEYDDFDLKGVLRLFYSNPVIVSSVIKYILLEHKIPINTLRHLILNETVLISGHAGVNIIFHRYSLPIKYLSKRHFKELSKFDYSEHVDLSKSITWNLQLDKYEKVQDEIFKLHNSNIPKYYNIQGDVNNTILKSKTLASVVLDYLVFKGHINIYYLIHLFDACVQFILKIQNGIEYIIIQCAIGQCFRIPITVLDDSCRQYLHENLTTTTLFLIQSQPWIFEYFARIPLYQRQSLATTLDVNPNFLPTHYCSPVLIGLLGCTKYNPKLYGMIQKYIDIEFYCGDKNDPVDDYFGDIHIYAWNSWLLPIFWKLQNYLEAPYITMSFKEYSMYITNITSSKKITLYQMFDHTDSQVYVFTSEWLTLIELLLINTKEIVEFTPTIFSNVPYRILHLIRYWKKLIA